MDQAEAVAELVERLLGRPLLDERQVRRKAVELLPEPGQRDKGRGTLQLRLAEHETEHGYEEIHPGHAENERVERHAENGQVQEEEPVIGDGEGVIYVVVGDEGLDPEPEDLALVGPAFRENRGDRQKRRMMAEVSARKADLTVLTAEDPRTESLDEILKEMAEGARAQGGKEGETFWRIPDRRAAIRFALRQARPGDVVLACGKGHEQSMCF